MHLHILALTACALATNAGAKQSPATSNLDVPDLCQFVAENLTETDPTEGTDRVYKSRLFAAAGVDPQSDSPEVTRAKMQAWWKQHQSELICNVPNSIVRNGSILKLAVDSSSTDFINDAVRRWKVDLNRIDADGTTVLDFIEQQRARSQGTPRFAILNRYYIIFASNGAKHARHLGPVQASKHR